MMSSPTRKFFIPVPLLLELRVRGFVEQTVDVVVLVQGFLWCTFVLDDCLAPDAGLADVAVEVLTFPRFHFHNRILLRSSKYTWDDSHILKIIARMNLCDRMCSSKHDAWTMCPFHVT
jgi:hypothetical protein